MKRMKRLLCTVFTVVMLFSVLSSAALAQGQNESGGSDKPETESVSDMLVFGDSIPAGYGLENFDGSDNSKPKDCFANILCRHYGLEYGKNFMNYAKSGMTSAEIYEQIRSAGADKLKSADIIIINAGGNDVIEAIETTLYPTFAAEQDRLRSAGINENFGTLSGLEKGICDLVTTPEAKASFDMIMNKCSESTSQNTYTNTVLTYDLNVRNMVSYIRECGSDANIIFLTAYDPTLIISGNPLSDCINKMLIDMNEKTISLASSGEFGHNLSVVDLYNDFRDNILVMTNVQLFDIHPSVEGHKHIAKLLIDGISAVTTEKKTSEESRAAEKNAPYSDTVVYILFGIACAAVLAIIINTVIRRKKK